MKEFKIKCHPILINYGWEIKAKKNRKNINLLIFILEHLGGDVTKMVK